MSRRNNNYVEWLKTKNIPLYEGGGVFWRIYQHALIPAAVGPSFVELSPDDAKKLLDESGTLFLRYTSRPTSQPTAWWFILCDEFNFNDISSKTRYNIKRGHRECAVKRLSADWLAENGYACYSAAFERYQNAAPLNPEAFRDDLLSKAAGPFEYWGVFVGEQLAGYCECIMEDDYICTNISKYDPAFLKQRTSYALIHHLLTFYVAEQGLTIFSGFRNISHETNYQDFLLNFGYRKQYCNLNIFYQPWLKITVDTLYPLNGVIQKLPSRGALHKFQALLHQEELRRKCHEYQASAPS